MVKKANSTLKIIYFCKNQKNSYFSYIKQKISGHGARESNATYFSVC